MGFLEWISEPETREELAEIRRCLRCTEAEAVMVLQLGALAEAMDALGQEMTWLMVEGDDEEE